MLACFRYPFLCCEILASEVWAIVDGVFRADNLVEKLFNFLDREPPLHPILASFVSRVTTVLLDRKPQQVRRSPHHAAKASFFIFLYLLCR